MLLPSATSPSSFTCGFPTRVSSKCPIYRSIRLSCYCGTSSGERDDRFYMRRCVELAKRATGCTSPNPMVGCVIVRDGQVVGEGFHPKAGQPHAEVFALRDAGDLAENATAYVSLEPCNHYGRTPPCTEALLQAKVKRVVVGMVDPNPIVASKGVERLQNSGISVTVGVEERLCRKLNEAYIHKMLTGRPFVTLRYSLSINGGFLDQLGKDAEECGGYYSKLLQENDGILLSSNLLAKNVALPFSKEPGSKQPLNIIIARKENSPLHLPVHSIGPDTKATIILEKDVSLDSQTEACIKQQSLDVVVLDQINLSSILEYCSSQGFCSLFLDVNGEADCREFVVEGLEKGLVQKIVMEICPIWSSTKESLLWDMRKKPLQVNDIISVIVKESALVEGYLT